MRVLVVAVEHRRGFFLGGLYTFLMNYVHYLRKYIDEVYWMGFYENKYEEVDNDIIVDIPHYYLYSYRNYYWLMKPFDLDRVVNIIKNVQPDVIHLHDYHALLPVLKYKERIDPSVGIVVTYHAFMGDEWSISFSGKIARIVTVSKRMKKYYERFVKNVDVIYNATPDPLLEPRDRQREDIIARFREIPRPRILYLGRTDSWKGIDVFIKATEEYRKHRVIIGDGTESYGGFGMVSWSERDLIIRESDICVFPSTNEPFGLVALEYMIRGCSSIVSKETGVAELLDNRVAYLVKPNAYEINRAIKLLMERNDLRETYSVAGRAFASGLTWDKVVCEYIKIYYDFYRW